MKKTSIVLDSPAEQQAHEDFHASGRAELIVAVGLARGIEDRLHANPDAAEPSHAFALLRYAAKIAGAEVDA